MNPIKDEQVECSIEKALNIIGGKWSFLVLKELFKGTRRFGELQRRIKDISPTALTNTLRHLEKNEILTREAFATVPVTVEYSLTEKGQELHKILKEMKSWGAKWG
ncbi:helix-turn-helix domain-containing protein [Pseudalkalibacillus hwajinpoensis]|uniref:winged helix-turn-helix transcriptional regulator n=1 Tax=Guptibacillus hwajinpoensis TaxID=208199 RepID=UPI00325A4DC0